LGYRKDIALSASAQANAGTAKMILELKKSPLEIRDMVTTPGGVTIAGLQELEKIPIRYAFMSAVVAADKKSKKSPKTILDLYPFSLLIGYMLERMIRAKSHRR